MTETKLTRHWNIMDYIDAIKMLGTKLKYEINDKYKINSLPFFGN